MTRPRATLALPVFNERPTIRATLAELHSHVIQNIPRYAWEILVVDDGSGDDSVDEIVRAGEEMRLPIRLLAHEVNMGLGDALSTIFRESRGDLIVTVDADLTYSVEHVARLVEAWEETGAAVVVASPYTSGGATRSVPRGLEIRSRIANRYLAAMTGDQVATFTGIVRAYDGDFVRSLPPLRGGPNANIDVLHEAWRRHLDVVEIPAVLDWTGQESRRRRHAMLSLRSIGESLNVLNQGARLHRVTRARRRPSGGGAIPAQRTIDLRDGAATEPVDVREASPSPAVPDGLQPS